MTMSFTGAVARAQTTIKGMIDQREMLTSRPSARQLRVMFWTNSSTAFTDRVQGQGVLGRGSRPSEQPGVRREPDGARCSGET